MLYVRLQISLHDESNKIDKPVRSQSLASTIPPQQWQTVAQSTARSRPLYRTTLDLEVESFGARSMVCRLLLKDHTPDHKEQEAINRRRKGGYMTAAPAKITY